MARNRRLILSTPSEVWSLLSDGHRYGEWVTGTQRVLDATAAVGAGAFVYASSVGAYSPGPKDRRVDETWPTDGVPSSFYSRHKAATERKAKKPAGAAKKTPADAAVDAEPDAEEESEQAG